MRALLVVIGIILVLILAGWISINIGPGRTSVHVETEEIRSDARQAINEGAELLNSARDETASDHPASQEPIPDSP